MLSYNQDEKRRCPKNQISGLLKNLQLRRRYPPGTPSLPFRMAQGGNTRREYIRSQAFYSKIIFGKLSYRDRLHSRNKRGKWLSALESFTKKYTGLINLKAKSYNFKCGKHIALFSSLNGYKAAVDHRISIGADRLVFSPYSITIMEND